MGRVITVKRAAANGAAFLDKYMPDWYTPANINTGELDLSDGAYCIVGQLNGGHFAPEDFVTEKVSATVVGGGEGTEDKRDERNKIDTGLRIPGFTVEEHKNVCVSREVEIKMDPEAMGFVRSEEATYSALTEAWLEEIHTRRERDRAARSSRNRSARKREAKATGRP